MGGYNRGLVLETIRTHTGCSRVEVAHRTGLTAQAVSNIVRRLIADGLIAEDGRGESTGGKPRTRLRLRPNAGYAVGVQIDPGELSFVLIDLGGRVRSRARRRVSPQMTPADALDRIAVAVPQLVGRAAIDAKNLMGIGVACPGPIDYRTGSILDPPNLPRWGKVPLADDLSERIGLPVTLDNDTTAAAIGERWSGGAADVASFVFIYMGTGIGGGVFLDGQVYRGSTTNAGEIGHVCIDPDGPECRCGSRGCLEATCSPAATIARIRRLSARRRNTLGLSFESAEVETDYERVCRAAAAGQPAARHAVEQSATALAVGVQSLVNVLDPDLVVLGGWGVRQVGDIFRDKIRAAVRHHCLARRQQRVRIAISAAGRDAAPIGAASLVFHDAYAPHFSGSNGSRQARA